MEELVNRIAEVTEISQGEARKAVLITAGYLKSKLQPTMSDEIDLILALEELEEEDTKYIGLFKMP